MAVSSGTVQVVMPAMGDSVAEGTVLEWRKQEGDSVEADETIVEISTDKVDAEVPSPAAGRIVKIHAAEGETVAVGAPLAEISTNGDGGVEVPATPVSGESPPATAHEAVASAATEAEGSRMTRAAREFEAGCRAHAKCQRRRGLERRDDRHRHPDRRRVGHRGDDPRVERQGGRRGQAGRNDRRDLDRQGRHGAARAGQRNDHRDPGRGGGDGERRAGDRADERRRHGHSHHGRRCTGIRRDGPLVRSRRMAAHMHRRSRGAWPPSKASISPP